MEQGFISDLKYSLEEFFRVKIAISTEEVKHEQCYLLHLEIFREDKELFLDHKVHKSEFLAGKTNMFTSVLDRLIKQIDNSLN